MSASEGLAGLLGGYGSGSDEEEAVQPITEPRQFNREESNLTSALATYGSNEAPPVAQSGSEAGTDADGELPEPTSAAGNGDAAAQAAQVLPNAAVNPEPPSSMDADMQDAEQQAGEQQAPADPLDLLPPEYRTSPGEVDPVLQARVANFISKQAQGLRMLDQLRAHAAFRNPTFLQQCVQNYQIQQYGSALATQVFDPAGLAPEDYYDELCKQLEEQQRQRQAERKEKQQVQFVAGGVQQAAAAAAGRPVGLSAQQQAAAQLAAQRAQGVADRLAGGLNKAGSKSKWDSGGR